MPEETEAKPKKVNLPGWGSGEREGAVTTEYKDKRAIRTVFDSKKKSEKGAQN